MDAILKQLASLEWWFTVVICGIVVSIFSAYAKDWITIALSSFSSRYRKLAEIRKASMEMEIEQLSQHREMLLIEYIRTGFRLAKVIALLVGSAVFPAWTAMQKRYPEMDPLTQLFGWPPITFGFPVHSDLVSSLLSLTLLVYGLIELNAFLNRYTLCEKAREKVNQK